MAQEKIAIGIIEFFSSARSEVKMSTHHRAVVITWPYSVLNAAAVPPAQVSRRSSLIVLRKLLI